MTVEELVAGLTQVISTFLVQGMGFAEVSAAFLAVGVGDLQVLLRITQLTLGAAEVAHLQVGPGGSLVSARVADLAARCGAAPRLGRGRLVDRFGATLAQDLEAGRPDCPHPSARTSPGAMRHARCSRAAPGRLRWRWVMVKRTDLMAIVVVGLLVVAGVVRAEEPAPTGSPPVPEQETAVPKGDWVMTSQYGWLYLPFSKRYASVVGESGWLYAFGPLRGWHWLEAPWLLGKGPAPRFNMANEERFAWRMALRHDVVVHREEAPHFVMTAAQRRAR